jgi:hypothetical protein
MTPTEKAKKEIESIVVEIKEKQPKATLFDKICMGWVYILGALGAYYWFTDIPMSYEAAMFIIFGLPTFLFCFAILKWIERQINA